MTNSGYSVHILVDGNTVKEYSKDGKSFIEAKHGSEYTIKVKNNTNKRALAVISVDSINVITGKIATPDDTGYVINAWGTLNLQGYRKDQEGGGKFKFTDKGTGYAKEVDGTGANSGVIGVTVIEEQDVPKVSEPIDWDTWIKPHPMFPHPHPTPYRRSYPAGDPIWLVDHDSLPTYGDSTGSPNLLRSTTTCDAFAPPNDNSLRSCSTMFCASVVPSEAQPFDSATTWGEEFKQKVDYVEFVRSTKTVRFELYYATRDSLKTLGVIVDQKPAVSFPQSFPGFAKPPANWKK